MNFVQDTRWQKENDRITKSFTDYFSNCGYTKLRPVSITSHIDRTVYLVNSATNLFKHWFTSEDVSVFAVQRCMRTQSLNDYYDKKNESEYPTCFSSFGAYVSWNKLNQLVADSVNYLLLLGFEVDRLRVRASPYDGTLIDSIRKTPLGARLVFDKHSEKYDHQYGTGITGRAVKIDGFHDEMQRFKNICYLITIHDDGVDIGAELATSDSLLLLRQHQLEFALSVSKIADILPLDSFEQRRLADSIMGASNLIYEGVRPNSSHMNGRTLKKYLIAMRFYSTQLHIPYEILVDTILQYIRLDRGNGVITKTVLDATIEEYCK